MHVLAPSGLQSRFLLWVTAHLCLIPHPPCEVTGGGVFCRQRGGQGGESLPPPRLDLGCELGGLVLNPGACSQAASTWAFPADSRAEWQTGSRAGLSL